MKLREDPESTITRTADVSLVALPVRLRLAVRRRYLGDIC